jgi:hypothetical protein
MKICRRAEAAVYFQLPVFPPPSVLQYAARPGWKAVSIVGLARYKVFGGDDLPFVTGSRFFHSDAHGQCRGGLIEESSRRNPLIFA